MQIFNGKHEGFISEEQFEKVHNMASNRNSIPINKELAYPFSRLLYCSRCGKALNYQPYTDGRQCRVTHKNNYAKCSLKSFSLSAIQEDITEALKLYIDDFQIKIDNGNTNDEASRIKETISILQDELSKAKNKKVRLFDAYESDNGMYTAEEFIERKICTMLR